MKDNIYTPSQKNKNKKCFCLNNMQYKLKNVTTFLAMNKAEIKAFTAVNIFNRYYYNYMYELQI